MSQDLRILATVKRSTFDATSELNNEYSYDELEQLLRDKVEDEFDAVDYYEYEYYYESDGSDDEDFDDKEGRRLLLEQQAGDKPGKSKFAIKEENLRILAALKADYKAKRVAFSNYMIAERVLTRSKYPTISQHFLELFPRLSRVPMSQLILFKADFTKGFNSGMSARVSGRPDRSSSDPSQKNMCNFHKWLQTVDLESVHQEMVSPKKLSVLRLRRKPVKHKNMHIVLDDLNGNNGEFTGDDDLASAAWMSSDFGNTQVGDVYEGFSKTKHKAKKGEKPKKSKLAKLCTHFSSMGECAFGDDCKFTHDTSLLDKPEIIWPDDIVSASKAELPTKTLYVSNTHIAWDGEFIYIDGVSLCGKQAPSRLDVGTSAEGVGCGWFIMVHSTKTKDCKVHVITDPIVHHRLPSQRYLDNWVAGFDGPVFQPALERIIREIPCLGIVDKAKSATALAIISRFFKGLPDYLVINTHRYWSLRNLAFKRSTLESTDTARVLAQERVEFLQSQYNSSLMAQVYRDNHISYNTVTWLPVPASECAVKPPAILKFNFTAVCKGVVWDRESLDNPYPIFNTQASHYRWYTTQMCRFEGTGPAFVVYDNTPHNMSLAMKRLIAARPDEDTLYRSQLWLAMQLAYRKKPTSDLANAFLQPGYTHTSYIEPDILSWCKCKPEHVGRPVTYRAKGNLPHKVRIGVGDSYHEVVFTQQQLDGFEDYPDVVLDAIMRPSNRTSRSHLETIYDLVVNKATKTYYRVYEAYTEYLDAHGARDHAGNIDHIKKRLRQSYVKGVLLHLDEDCMVKSLTACVKREFAKAGKVPRLFIDYSKGCMYASELPEWVKECIDGAYHFTFGSLETRIFIFAKPKASVLQEELNYLISSTTRDHNCYNVLLFSDDSVHAGNVNGVSFAYNVDITSTDSSNATLVFALTANALAKFNRKRAKGLVAQCCRPILCINPVQPAEKITIQFHGPFEGSGTVLTTILNHTASYVGAVLSAYSMSQAISKLSDNDSIDPSYYIKRGYAQSGHLVTCEMCGSEGVIIPEKMQFLKRSPIWNGASWIPTMNLGCILRGFGTLDSDIKPAQLGLSTNSLLEQVPWEDRMDIFLGGIVRGLVHEHESCILRSLRNRFNAGVHVMPDDTVLGRHMDRTDYVQPQGDVDVFDQSLAKRYDVSVTELHELAAHISSIALGGVSVTQAATNIYRVDYGLESPTPAGTGENHIVIDTVYSPR